MPSKKDLCHELDDGIKDARQQMKRARSAISKARLEGREAALQEVREVFIGTELPEDA